MFKTIVLWTDLEDNNHRYNVGDIYPREGIFPTENRIRELSTSANRRGFPLIEKIEEAPAKRGKKNRDDD